MLDTIFTVVVVGMLAIVLLGGLVTIVTGITESLADSARAHRHGGMALHH